MKTVAVRFILEGGAFFNVVLPEAEVQALLEQFRKGGLGRTVGSTAGSVGHQWCLQANRILGMHTFDPAEGQQAAVDRGRWAPSVISGHRP